MNTTTLPNDQPLTRIIPCKARGVGDSHTPRDAYFEIPVDCQHGKMFQCSFPACRDSERRFRYCKVCDEIVAKRNFSKRHRHPADEVATSSDDSVSIKDNKRRKLLHVGSDGDSSTRTKSCTIADDLGVCQRTSINASRRRCIDW